MQVGDLVQIESWCKNKGALAIVVRTETWMTGGVWIKYLDGSVQPTNAEGLARKKNLILISKRGEANENRG